VEWEIRDASPLATLAGTQNLLPKLCPGPLSRTVEVCVEVEVLRISVFGFRFGELV
jgi:hypothetical protein